jgi:hypothetical protein
MKNLFLILTLMMMALPMAIAGDEAGSTLCNQDRTTLELLDGFTQEGDVCKDADGNVVDCSEAVKPASAEEN